MRTDPEMLLAAAGVLFALSALLTQWRNRVQARRERELLRKEFEMKIEACSETSQDLKKVLEALEESVRKAPELPAPGAMHRSVRTRALQLLRSGVSPDTAASSLAVSRREIRLLDQVAQLLYPR